MHNDSLRWTSIILAVCLLGVSTFAMQNRRPASSLSPETRGALLKSLARGGEFLLKEQKPDGVWENHPGITAIAATALLRQTGTTPKQQFPRVQKSLEYLTGIAKPDGGLYVRDVPHYVTAVSLMALVAAERPEYRQAIEKARAFLVEQLVDEGEGYNRQDKFYGGIGYGADLRPDLANLEYGMRALKEAALPEDHSAWAKAIEFIQRTQNLPETNDQKGAGTDGGFMYFPGFTYGQGGGTQSYGSMTYAGLLSYSYANVKKTDPRVQAAFKWISDNYTVDENPNLGAKTLYYYYMVFAKALQAHGEPFIVDAKGVRHNWREDLAKKLIAVQNADGHWVNSADGEYLQDNKVLVTGFTMIAIEHILQD